MKLNETFTGVLFQTDKRLSSFYLMEHLNIKHKAGVDSMPLLAEITNGYYDKTVTNPWQLRVDIATQISAPAKNVFYITDSAKQIADKVKFEKIDLKWFKQLPSLDCLYITGKNEMYRFIKNEARINVLYYEKREFHYWYDSYSLILNDGKLATLPSQDIKKAEMFIKMLLFMELGDITIQILKPNGKIRYGKSGDDRIKNEAGIEVKLITANWNKITVVAGDIAVRGHLRMQPCGAGRTQYKLVWINDYTKGGYVRKSGREQYKTNSQ